MACSKNVVRASCAEIFHPWTQDCSDAYRSMFRLSVIGCSKLYLSIMLVDYALGLRKKKKMNKETIKNIITKYFQSITMTTCLNTSFLVYNCFLRLLLGRYNYSTTAFLPGIFSGLWYIMLTPKNRVQILATTSNALIFNRIDVPSLRHIPMDTIVFCISMGVILHIQLFYPKSVSKMGSNFINMASGKRMKLMVDAFQKLNSNV